MNHSFDPGVQNLNKHLIAEFFTVVRSGSRWVRDNKSAIVKAPLSEAEMSIALNWQSPFEGAGVESLAPTMGGLIQSGVLSDTLSTLEKMLPDSAQSAISSLTQKAGLENTAELLRGRTGITSINSLQVFSGMPPVKLTVTAEFRAWDDAKKQVEQPIDALVKWALPVHLDKSNLAERLSQVSGGQSTLLAMFPSDAPVIVGMLYKRRLFRPMVIESVELPLSSPINRDGEFTSMSVAITLCSLTGIDRADWDNWRVL